MEILFFLAAFVSEIIGTTVGFGSSTVFLPLALLFFDFKTALVLVAFLHIFGNIGRISFFRHGLDKDLIIKFGLPSILLTIFGAILVSLSPQELLKGILGVFLTFYGGFSLWRDTIKATPSLYMVVIGGSLSGFLAGLIGTGGALRGMFLTSFNLPKEKYIATAAAIALAVDITRIPIYVNQGFLSSRFYWYIPVLLLIALAGSFIGKKIVTLIPQILFRKIVLLALIVIGLKFIFDFVY